MSKAKTTKKNAKVATPPPPAPEHDMPEFPSEPPPLAAERNEGQTPEPGPEPSAQPEPAPRAKRGPTPDESKARMRRYYEKRGSELPKALR